MTVEELSSDWILRGGVCACPRAHMQWRQPGEDSPLHWLGCPHNQTSTFLLSGWEDAVFSPQEQSPDVGTQVGSAPPIIMAQPFEEGGAISVSKGHATWEL